MSGPPGHLSDEWKLGLTEPMFASSRNLKSHFGRIFSPDRDYATSADRNGCVHTVSFALSYKHHYPPERPYATLNNESISRLASALETVAGNCNASHIQLWIDKHFEKNMSRARHSNESWIRFGLQPYFSLPVLFFDTAQPGWTLERCVKRGWLTLEHAAGMNGKGLASATPVDTNENGARPNLWGLHSEDRIERVRLTGVVSIGENQKSAEDCELDLCVSYLTGFVRRELESFTDSRDFPALIRWANEVVGSLDIYDIFNRDTNCVTASCDWNQLSFRKASHTVEAWLPAYLRCHNLDLFVGEKVLHRLHWCAFKSRRGRDRGVYAVASCYVKRGSHPVFLIIELSDESMTHAKRSKRFYVEEDSRLMAAISDGQVVGTHATELIHRATDRRPEVHLGYFSYGQEPWI